MLGILLGHSSPLYAIRKSYRSIKGASSLASHSRLSSALARIVELERENARLAAQNLQERQYQSQLFDRARRAVFRALPYKNSPANAFTGTLIQVTHRGKKEIFGVVASHTLQSVPFLDGLLGREFQAVYIHNNVAHTIPAKIVQFSPFTMRDLALVKFPAEYESMFDPIVLEDFHLELPTQGYSQGYACNILSKQTFPIVGINSTGTLTSRLPAAELGQRSGLCGSPVFTTDFHLMGIHIGSSYKTNVGYIAPVSAIKNLIQAYHAPAQSKPFSLSLAGREIGRLAVDEYLSRIELLDEHYRTLWKEDTQAKFSLANAEQELASYPQAAFIRLTLGHSSWEQGPKGTYVFDDNSNPRIIITPLK